MDDEIAFGELRVEILQPLSLCVMASGLAALALLFDDRPVTWLPAVSLVTAGYLVFRLADAASAAASVLLTASLLLILTGCVLLYPGVPLALLYGLVVLPTAFLVGPATTALATAFSLVVLIGGQWAYPGMMASEVCLLAVFAVSCSGFVSWAIARPFVTALSAAWGAHARAEEQMTEARARQGELARVTKSLNETLDKLENLTRRLDEARAAAEEARRLKAQFAAAVSHELRTPINIIVGFAEMLASAQRSRQADATLDACRGQIEAIYRNACHVSSLVDDILELSQIDAHRLALHKETVSLRDVVLEAVAAVENLFDAEGLTLSVDVPATVPELQADRARLRQVLINLLSNACRFTDEGVVAVSVRRDEHDVIVAVADTGIGMPPDELPLVFQEFQLSARGGHGLGLSVSKRLIELHGGSMWVESVPGRGSTFYFSLPLADTVLTSPRSRSLRRGVAAVASREARRTLVVVEGDGKAGKIAGRYLDGYHVETVSDVDKARRALGEGRAVAVLLCDAKAAESWCEQQSREPIRYPVAVCPLRTNQGADLGPQVVAFLTKPVTQQQLGAALDGLRRRWRSVGIVEDHPEMGDLLAQMVRSLRRRCWVWRAADGREALALLRQRRPDVLLLDLLMPSLSGYELLEEMSADPSLSDVPVIVVTGAEDRDERIVAEMVGVTRPGGLAVGEAMTCLKASLDALLGGTRGSDRA